ncbi:MAG: hypothetical protein AAGA94_08990 [Pseudomonadota bacterium]
MYKPLSCAALCIAPQITGAHDFWMEPNAFLLDRDAALSVTVRIGENLEGAVFPFDPRAYKYAFWRGDGSTLDLALVPLRSPVKTLAPLGNGLHSLTVSSFPQSFTYASQDDLRRFLQSVGQEHLLASELGRGLPDTEIGEAYKRSSKLLVHFGEISGADMRIGRDREWVAQENGFVLFDQTGVAADHPVQVYCKGDGPTSHADRYETRTDALGAVDPVLPANASCLLNAVFVEFGRGDSDLKSDWVSLYFRTPVGIE